MFFNMCNQNFVISNLLVFAYFFSNIYFCRNDVTLLITFSGKSYFCMENIIEMHETHEHKHNCLHLERLTQKIKAHIAKNITRSNLEKS